MDSNPPKLRALKSIGSKFRIMPTIRTVLQETGADLLVDVFGGSGSVIMNAGFFKRIYNDLDGDLVNFFRVLRDDELRPLLLKKLRWTPMSRKEFNDLDLAYKAGNRSFSRLSKVDRAFATFYRSNYVFGGKMKSGGFSVSAVDRTFIKEAKTYRSRLKNISQVADFWKYTVIENLHFQELIENYGRRTNAVLYCDPPYYGTEGYYARTIQPHDHVFLAEQLNSCAASVVVSYYEFDSMSDLYSPDVWKYLTIKSTKNCLRTGKSIDTATEFLLIRKNHA